MPNVATPAMLTAGPIGSDGGASRSPRANCARVSSTVRGDRISVLPTAKVWSTLSRLDDAGRRAEAAGAARIRRGHVVAAVANVELIAAAELVIELGQHVGGVPGPDRCPSRSAGPHIRSPASRAFTAATFASVIVTRPV